MTSHPETDSKVKPRPPQSCRQQNMDVVIVEPAKSIDLQKEAISRVSSCMQTEPGS